jgi:C4-dicarboxylate-specific signal transduction histidine kinase
MPAQESIDGRLLEQLMQMARTAALEEMASGFAHELNQPIGAIATFAQAAERMLARPEPLVMNAREVLTNISDEALNAGKGIRRIRQLFNGRSTARKPGVMEEALRELLPVFDLLASRTGTTLEIETAPDLPLVNMDRLRIQHVLFTLVQNALESPRETGRPNRVQVRLSGDKYGVTVSVVDQGIGVAEEHRPQLFRPFFTTKNAGTGLGLASSRAIVESHEGTIGFDENNAEGSRFWFTLPASV